MRHVLLITLQQYTSGYSTAIRSAVERDAYLFDRLITELGGSVVQPLGVDGSPVSRASIQQTIEGVLRKAGPDDDVVVY